MQFQWPFKFKKTSKRGYEGAARSRRTKNWISPRGDANATIKRDLPWLRDRSRNLRRNNAHAHKGIEVITNNVVGKGISTQIDNDPSGLNKKLFEAWAGSTACDYEGRNNLKGLQRLIMDAVVESGEVIVRKRFVTGPFPIQYQVLESDFLDTNKITGVLENGNRILQGIEFDEFGKRVGYHLFEQHPAASVTSLAALKSNLIPASEIYHLFRMERPGQVRGVPWLSPVMIAIKDLGDFFDGELLKQKIASLFVAFVRDLSADADCDDTQENLGEKLVPGLIEHLPAGKSVEFANPPEYQNFKEFTVTNLKMIAAGLGITYEALASDYSDVNFSSGRMGWIEMGRNIDSWRQHIMINQFLDGVNDDYKMVAMLSGVDSSAIRMEHIAPRREMIDPEKELKAINLAIRSGMDSRTAAIQSLGRDPDKIHEQQVADNAKVDKDKLILDSDPRYTTIGGSLQGEAIPVVETESTQNNSGDD